MAYMHIEPTRITPFVEMDSEQGFFNLRGRSSPESCLQFFTPVIDSLREYFPERERITANFDLEYFNTSSSRWVFNILKELEQFSQKGKNVTVNWYYQDWDDDMKYTGEDYEELVGMEFNYIEISS